MRLVSSLAVCTVVVLVAVLAVTAAPVWGQDAPLYMDPKAPIEERVNDLLARMTLEEKVAQLGGDTSGMATPDNERLGIPGFKMADGPHGVRWDQSTCFPTLLALGSTWDPELVQRVAAALGREFRGKGRYVALGPCINLIRDPRGGRSFETFGEDPCLVGRLTAAYVRGMQGERVIATPKHYACNNQENGRGENDVQVSERTLREVYLRAFQAAVQEGGAWAVMAAYNKVNGHYCTANHYLLREVLKGDWGFRGFVMSDWGALHTTVEAMHAGLDVEMPTAHFYGQPLLEAVKRGEVTEEEIDDAVRRVLRAKFWAGVFEDPVEPDESKVNTPEHQALAREAATRAIVLLKNDRAILPLDPARVERLAVIGPNANVPQPTGGGSAHVTPYYAVSPLDGIRRRAGEDMEIVFAQGCELFSSGALPAVPREAVAPPGGEPGVQGLRGEYFDNARLEGEPVFTRLDPTVQFDWGGGSPGAGIGADRFSVRWTGTLTPPASGDYLLATTTDDGARLWIDDRLIIDDWRDHATETRSEKVFLEAGRAYTIRMEYYENWGQATARLGWQVPGDQEEAFAEAQRVARGADAAVVVVGTSPRLESEGFDREHLDLPAPQDELVQAVAQANPNTIVAIVSGSAVLMHRWVEQVPAVLQCWFNGQEAGNAVAAVLFGDHNPSGRLPLTFPRTEDQLPPFNNDYESVEEGRGYRYYDAKGLEPLFPFGHGLSYTTFAYGELRITGEMAAGEGSIRVAVDVTNTGALTGTEVVQVYVRAVDSRVPRPMKELKGFAPLVLRPGQTQTAAVSLSAADLSFWDEEASAFVLEPGEFEILVGSSSRDIRDREALMVR